MKNNALCVLRENQDQLFFLGNSHETVPRRLLLARNLSPREKFTWQLLRLNAHDTGNGLFPSYTELQCWLSDRPDSDRASRSTVSHTLTMLRLTRWLSLCRRLRDEKTGQMAGNIYALYDNPLSFEEACQLDEEYLSLLATCTQHRNRPIRTTAIALLLAMNRDFPVNSGLPCTESSARTRPGLTERPGAIYPGLSVRPGGAPGPGGLSDRRAVLTDTVLTVNKRKRTVGVCWPVDNPFSPGERRIAERVMQDLDEELCQRVVDDGLYRIAQGDVRRPLAYLLAMLERAHRGEFNRLRRRR